MNVNKDSGPCTVWCDTCNEEISIISAGSTLIYPNILFERNSEHVGHKICLVFYLPDLDHPSLVELNKDDPAQ